MLVFVLQILLLLFTARICGEIAQRLGQPSVVGEIIAGILLGSTVMGGLLPGFAQRVMPQTEIQLALINNISLIGLILLLLITGLEIDLTLIKRHAKTAIGVSWGGIIVTLLSGYLLGSMLPDFLMGADSERIIFALFIAVSMSISAIPILAKILFDLNLIRRDLGQAILAAGMNDDIVGWILLSVVTGMASGHALTFSKIIFILGSVVIFIVVSFTAGRWLARNLLDVVQDTFVSRDRILTLVIILTLGWSAFSNYLNLEIAIGAFVMGIIFSQLPRLPVTVIERVESMALGIFAPIFFAVVGLKVDVSILMQPSLLLISLAVITVACVGKFAGTFAGAKIIAGKDNWSALCFGAGLNARGAMEIIVATIGLNTGIISHSMFSIIVLMAIVTSLISPPALKWAFSRIIEDSEETERITRERLLRKSLIGSVHRILLPVRERNIEYDPIQLIKSKLLDRWSLRSNLSLTIFSVIRQDDRAKSRSFFTELTNFFRQKEISRKTIVNENAADTILDEAKRDYDLLVVGSSKKHSGTDILFTPLVDYLVRFSPCSTMVVYGDYIHKDWMPSTILVPVNGTIYSKNSAELAFILSSGVSEKVVLLNVILRPLEIILHDQDEEYLKKELTVAQNILTELYELGLSYRVKVSTMVREGVDLNNAIMEAANEESADLIILGTNIRAGHDKLYLGPRVEKILRDSPCPVVVMNT